MAPQMTEDLPARRLVPDFELPPALGADQACIDVDVVVLAHDEPHLGPDEPEEGRRLLGDGAVETGGHVPRHGFQCLPRSVQMEAVRTEPALIIERHCWSRPLQSGVMTLWTGI